MRVERHACEGITARAGGQTPAQDGPARVAGDPYPETLIIRVDVATYLLLASGCDRTEEGKERRKQEAQPGRARAAKSDGLERRAKPREQVAGSTPMANKHQNDGRAFIDDSPAIQGLAQEAGMYVRKWTRRTSRCSLGSTEVGPPDARQEGHAGRNHGSDQERSRIEGKILGRWLDSLSAGGLCRVQGNVLKCPGTSSLPLHLTDGEGDAGECCTTR